MKTLKLAAVAFAGALLLAPTLTMAQSSTPGIDQRQANQERRIDQGVQSGKLTKKEARKVQRGQNKVNRMEARAKADGTVTKTERAKIQKAQNKQSRKIKRQKNDSQTRPVT